MQRHEWINAYTLITNKLNKRKPLTAEEIEELVALIQKLQEYLNKVGFEVLKKQ